MKILRLIILLSLLIFTLFLYSISTEADTYTEIEVFGTSMYPSIKEGDVCYIDKNFPFENLKIGDVVMYKDKGMIIFEYSEYFWIHRIIGKTNEGYTMKGDNNRRNDPFILTSFNYRGKVVEIE